MLEYWKQENLTIYFLDYAMMCIKNAIEKSTKSYILSFQKKDDLRITKNFALLLNFIWPEGD